MPSVRVSAPQSSPIVRELSLLPSSLRLTRPRSPDVERGATHVDGRQSRGTDALLGNQILGLPLGVAVVDRNYDVQTINDAAYKLLEISRLAVGRDLLHLASRVPTKPFRAAIEVFTPINPPRVQSASQSPPSFSTGTGPRRRRRPLTLGGKILRDFSSLHYGNFGGWPLKALYVLLGFIPVVLLGSALIMWWNRVLWPAVRRVTSSRQFGTNSWGSWRARRASRPPTA